MARYAEAKCRMCRREGLKLHLKGAKCDTAKCPFAKKATPPGEYASYPRMSVYGNQLREKQKVKRMYGVMERQFKRLFTISKKDKEQTGLRLLQLMELRLDNVVYRLGFAQSRAQARQLVMHGHVKVNGKRVDIPSYIVSVNQEVVLIDKIKTADWQKEFRVMSKGYKVPKWLGVREDGTGIVLKSPDREDIDPGIREELIVEYYSR